MNAVRTGLALLCLGASVVGAQRPDSIRPMPSLSSIPRDSLIPPIGPRRAFFYSFLAPGYSQTVLGRHKAASASVLVEAISLAMIRESAADLHEARRFVNDTIVLSYDASGAAITKVGRFTNKEVK